MEWQVKIEGHPKQRILISFDPQGEMISFCGQYSIRNHWIDFSMETHSMEIDLEIIQSLIEKVYDTMNKRVKVYEDLDKSFDVIKEVKIQGEELVLATTVSDNSVFGSPVESTITIDEWIGNISPK